MEVDKTTLDDLSILKIEDDFSVFNKMNFFGGGHRNAGGGKIKDMTPKEVENRFKELLKEALV